jgi:hypothetical protein
LSAGAARVMRHALAEALQLAPAAADVRGPTVNAAGAAALLHTTVARDLRTQGPREDAATAYSQAARLADRGRASHAGVSVRIESRNGRLVADIIVKTPSGKLRERANVPEEIRSQSGAKRWAEARALHLSPARQGPGSAASADAR